MSVIGQVTCYTVSCSTCTTVLVDDDDREVHFPSLGDAVEYLTELTDWDITPGAVTCPDCRCHAIGRDWEDSITVSSGAQLRFCARCNTMDAVRPSTRR